MKTKRSIFIPLAGKIALLTVLFLYFLPVLKAQESISPKGNMSNPEIHEDLRVTFRIKAPEAKEVSLAGNWMPWMNTQKLEKGQDGTWSFTSEVFQPDIYWYQFIVDGVRTIDYDNTHVIRDVGTLWNVFIAGSGQADLYRVNKVPHGTLAYRWYDSPKNNKMRRLAVYTPPGYEQSNDDFPVLYLLHGLGGDEEAWVDLGLTVQIMDNLIAQGKAKPMIVVMPNGNVYQEAAPGQGSVGLVKPTFTLPNTMDGSFEASFDEIMNFVEDHYRTLENKSSRAIAGLSMGGYHAANISRFYPNTFDYMGLFSPALHADLSAHPEAIAYQNPDQMLQKQLENGYQLYWIRVGKDDFPALLAGIKSFKQNMDRLQMPYDYADTAGGHTWKNWREYLVEFVQLIF